MVFTNMKLDIAYSILSLNKSNSTTTASPGVFDPETLSYHGANDTPTLGISQLTTVDAVSIIFPANPDAPSHPAEPLEECIIFLSPENGISYMLVVVHD